MGAAKREQSIRWIELRERGADGALLRTWRRQEEGGYWSVSEGAGGPWQPIAAIDVPDDIRKLAEEEPAK